MSTDQFQYVIIQASDCYFGFNLLDEIERACIFALIHTKSNADTFDGWMVSKFQPKWVGSYSDCLCYEKQSVNAFSVNSNECGWIPGSISYSGNFNNDETNGSSNAESSNRDSDSEECFTYNYHTKKKEKEFFALTAGKSNKSILSSSDKDDCSGNECTNPSCDWAIEGRCILGLVPIKCQYAGGCNKFVHHLCTIQWACENNIDEGGIATLCRDHHPEYIHISKPSSPVYTKRTGHHSYSNLMNSPKGDKKSHQD